MNNNAYAYTLWTSLWKTRQEWLILRMHLAWAHHVFWLCRCCLSFCFSLLSLSSSVPFYFQGWTRAYIDNLHIDEVFVFKSWMQIRRIHIYYYSFYVKSCGKFQINTKNRHFIKRTIQWTFRPSLLQMAVVSQNIFSRYFRVVSSVKFVLQWWSSWISDTH